MVGQTQLKRNITMRLPILLLTAVSCLALTGCGPDAPKLHGMDLSGMPTGDFQLQDKTGQ